MGLTFKSTRGFPLTFFYISDLTPNLLIFLNVGMGG